VRSSLFITTLLVFVCTFVIPCFSKVHTAKVIGVADGDTITVLQDKKQYKIRLYGIDCPEKAQAYGNKAKELTSRLTFGKTVELTAYDVDRYQRIVAVVKVNGVNVNEELIKNGYAWRYPQYCKESFCKDWVIKEYYAKNSGKGLWKDNNPIPPWEWRHSPQKAKQVASNQAGRERQKQAYQQQVFSSGGSLHGNTKSHKYHNAGCRWYNCENCTQNFGSAQEARSAGYSPCGKCGG
jgi:endonuclease YncB( thermonuclease family)